ncbi:hypothetical protein ZWY2020_055895 [Hordeum vulgare]|nr:hypothetical protein ZWY2020_055895 [Hordeum vulgare]
MLFYASGVGTNADALHAGGHGLVHAQELLDMAVRGLQHKLEELLTSLPAVIRFRHSYGKPTTGMSACSSSRRVTANLQRLHRFSPSP